MTDKEKEAIEYYEGAEGSFTFEFESELDEKNFFKALEIDEEDTFEKHQIRFNVLLNLIKKQQAEIKLKKEQTEYIENEYGRTIENQFKRINELETALIDEQLKHSGEIEKKDNDIQRMQELLDLSDANNIEKDKIISKMAKFIDNNLKNCLLEVLNVNDVCERKELCKDCIIEYFEKEEG